MRIEHFGDHLLLVADEDHLLVGKPGYFPTPTTTDWWWENIPDYADPEIVEKTEERLKDMFVEIPDGDYRDILIEALYGGGDIE